MRSTTEIASMIARLRARIAEVREEARLADDKKRYTNEWLASQYAYVDEMFGQIAALEWVLGTSHHLATVDEVQA